MKRISISLLLCVFGTACATRPDRVAPADATAQIDRVIDKCGVREMITVKRLTEAEYRIANLDPSTPYKQADCFLSGVKLLALGWEYVSNPSTGEPQ